VRGAPVRAADGRWRRGLEAGATVAIVGLVAPGAAHAHGLVAQRDLPIPEWLVAWVAAAVLVLSFLLLAAAWSAPQLSPVRWRPSPSGIGRRLTSPLVEVAAGAVGVALLGDVFRLLNPWRALGRAAGRAIRSGRRESLRAYPERLGRWPAVAGLVAFAWLELASGWPEQPDRLAAAIVAYSAITLAAMSVFGVETWIRRGEAFSIYFGLLARLSVIEVRDRRIGLRPPLAGLSAPVAIPGTVAFVSTMIGSVTFDGLSEGPVWRGVARELNAAWLALGVADRGGGEDVGDARAAGLLPAGGGGLPAGHPSGSGLVREGGAGRRGARRRPDPRPRPGAGAG